MATAEGYLFIATTDAIIQEVLAVKAGQKIPPSQRLVSMSKAAPKPATHRVAPKAGLKQAKPAAQGSANRSRVARLAARRALSAK